MPRHPHGYWLSRDRLRSAPTLLEAIECMPAEPPKCADIELLRAWERAMCAWRNEILFTALAKEREGLNDLRRVEDRHLPRRSPGRAHAEPRAPPALPEDAPAARGAGRAALAVAAQDGAGLPRLLTAEEVANLARVSVHTVNKAIFLTRQGRAAPGSKWYLPRAARVRGGFHREDVGRWLHARGQLRGEMGAPSPRRDQPGRRPSRRPAPRLREASA